MNKAGNDYETLLQRRDNRQKQLKQEQKEKTRERTNNAIRRNQTEKQNMQLEQELKIVSETENAVVLEMLIRQARAAAVLPETNLT